MDYLQSGAALRDRWWQFGFGWGITDDRQFGRAIRVLDMDKTDFEFDTDLFQRQLGVAKFAIRSATQRLIELTEHWEQLGREYLGGAIAIVAAPQSNRFDGEVLGKKFSIHYSPLGRDESGVIEVSLALQDLVTGEHFEISRFLISQAGLLSAEGELLLNRDDQNYGYKALVAVVRRVMYSPSKA